ncbi:hypothetical protein GGD81_003323 [Rhodobium orientis]|uniref:UPF0235 protein CH339_05050 n=1 Tax=Rhodobium orientis TaxID=34017 RepID=A0A327JTJ9_9HYPH|nr:DUF167 family protein [Rhodobium orientis]MBB4304265.1 hypothetical protein [Rhodobium orientis]MBK5948240.1 hypothetical protein [Rhodobium orientis]RAI28773.1 hypothetical protein CH339_05050 [Rhodobium orientis]
MADLAGIAEIGPDALTLTVRLTPKASKDGIDGVKALSDGRQVLAARVRAVPEKGAANAALEKLLAKALGVGKSQVAVVSGATSRLKTVRIAGDGAAISSALQRALDDTA